MEEMNITKIRQILNHIEDQAKKEHYFNALHSCNDLSKGLLTNLQIAINRPPNNKKLQNVCTCVVPNPFVSEKYSDRCRTCSQLIPEQR